MRVVRLSWAGVQITSGEATLVLDLLENTGLLRPLLGEPRSPIVPASESLDLALVTHLHPDHYDPATLRSKLKPDAKVLCDRANVPKIAADGLHAVAANVDEPISAGPFTVTALPAVDGFGDPQISFLVEADGLKIVHCGDTLWHGHWWKIRGRHGVPNVAFLPINGAITQFPHMKPSGIPADMKPDEAAAAAAVLEAKLTCPIHYETFHNPPLYTEWPEAEQVFLDAAKRLAVPARVIEPGGEVPLS